MIGERLGEIRRDAGLSQEDLANELSISVHTIGSYEQDKSDPDDEVKLKIAKYFNVSLDYLIGAVDEQIPLNRTDRIDLPKGFPKQAIPEVKEYMKLMILKYKEKSKK